MLALVTGATGFVGSNLVELLLAEGWQVRVLRRPTSSPAGLAGLAVEAWEGDVTDPASLRPAMQGCDAVFHAAGVVADYWRQDLERLYRVNVEGTRHVVQAALAAGVPRLVFTSSLAALGFPADAEAVDETHPFNIPPAAYPYGHSKHLAEQEVQAGVAQGLHAVIVNPSVVLGPRDVYGQNSRIVLEVARGRVPWVPPGGANVVDVRDVARGHLLAWQRGRPGERYLLAGHNVTHLELTRQIAALLGVNGPRGVVPPALIGPLAKLLDAANRVRPLPLSGDVLRMGARFFYADNRKAVAELGLTVTPLEATLRAAIEWLRAAGRLPPLSSPPA